MHPSITAELILPPPLSPQEKMGRNEPCWCGSGKKWKRCHKDRHLQEPVPIGKIVHETQSIRKQGICLHVDEKLNSCTNHPIRSHTVQKQGGLAAISDNGHVISLKSAFERILKNDGTIIPQRIGIGQASTFMGFCAIHDNNIFLPIEQNSFELDNQTAFLLAYRAISYEFLCKRQALDGIQNMRQLDKGKNFSEQIFIQQNIHIYRAGLQRGMQDLIYWKKTYDKGISSGDYSRIKHYAIKFDGLLPFVSCGSFMPEFSFDGKPLQKLGRATTNLDHVSLNITSTNGQTFVVFAWLDNPKGPAEDFVRSFSSIKNEDKANACLHLACEHLENTYFQPSWWESLQVDDHKNIILRSLSGIAPEYERHSHKFTNMRKIINAFKISRTIEPIGF